MSVTKDQSPHLSNSTDVYARLVREAAGGDEAAMERLLVRAQEVAFRFSLLVCGHAQDAEDVMQDALIKTYRHVGSIKDPAAFRTWLFRTVHNACLMKRRRRAGEPARVESLDQSEEGLDGSSRGTRDVVSPDKGPDELALNSWLGERLRRALAQLPASYRMIVLLRETEGLSTRDVAAVTGISEDNVKTRLHRARVMLREALENQ